MNGNHSTVAFYGRTDEGGLIGQESLSKRCVLFYFASERHHSLYEAWCGCNRDPRDSE